MLQGVSGACPAGAHCIAGVDMHSHVDGPLWGQGLAWLLAQRHCTALPAAAP